jgi:hypothetical protein
VLGLIVSITASYSTLDTLFLIVPLNVPFKPSIPFYRRILLTWKSKSKSKIIRNHSIFTATCCGKASPSARCVTALEKWSFRKLWMYVKVHAMESFKSIFFNYYGISLNNTIISNIISLKFVVYLLSNILFIQLIILRSLSILILLFFEGVSMYFPQQL